MRRVVVLTALAVAACLGPGAARSEPTVTVLPLGFEVREMRGPGTRVAATAASVAAFRDDRAALRPPLAVVWGKDGAAALTLGPDGVRAVRARGGAGDLGSLETDRHSLPDSRIAGSGALSAELEGPTRDYPHEALGAPVHARVLAITERRPSPPSSEPKPVAQDVTRIPAGEGAVFEDREPRPWDRGGAGMAVLAVRSYRDRGSALAVFGRRDGSTDRSWALVAETPPDGEPFRWLNPVAGAAPPNEVALVRRPHLDGVLQVWRLDGDRFALRAEKAGYANHVYGSRAQDLSTWYVAEDGSARIAVPTLDRQALALLATGPDLKELARIPLPAKVATGVAALGRGREVQLVVGLEDGRVAVVKP